MIIEYDGKLIDNAKSLPPLGLVWQAGSSFEEVLGLWLAAFFTILGVGGFPSVMLVKGLLRREIAREANGKAQQKLGCCG